MASSRLGGAHNPDGSLFLLSVGRVFDAPILVLAAFLASPALPLAMVIQVPGVCVDSAKGSGGIAASLSELGGHHQPESTAMRHPRLHPLNTAPLILRTCDLVPNSLRCIKSTRSTAHRPTPRHWPRAQYYMLALLQIPSSPTRLHFFAPFTPPVAAHTHRATQLSIQSAQSDRVRRHTLDTALSRTQKEYFSHLVPHLIATSRTTPAFGFFAGAIAQSNLVEFAYARTYKLITHPRKFNITNRLFNAAESSQNNEYIAEKAL
ncbi:hypothetical protein B0H19DRAFT_1385114 [Mycena capillaripes]|nr:hypothetical protein B0H19DRAFT_1385114 [Mycena capillaripes]